MTQSPLGRAGYRSFDYDTVVTIAKFRPKIMAPNFSVKKTDVYELIFTNKGQHSEVKTKRKLGQM